MRILYNPPVSVWTGDRRSETAREQLDRVVRESVRAEELGFDGVMVMERHEPPSVSSSPALLLGAIAAHTTTIRLFTGVATIGLHDPVRAFEDYATVDVLSGGRLEMIIGKGSRRAQRELFGVAEEDQWDRLAEAYELLRLLWSSERVTWSGRFRPPLTGAAALPRPVQPRLTIWHGSATDRRSTELAARHGDPLFSANAGGPVDRYADLVAHYRERWAAHGRDPAAARVGAGTAGLLVARTSQQAVAAFAPVFAARQEQYAALGVPSPWADLDDFLARSSALVGSPEQVVDQVHRQQAALGHEILYVQQEAEGVDDDVRATSVELFASHVAPALRRSATPCGVTPPA